SPRRREPEQLHKGTVETAIEDHGAERTRERGKRFADGDVVRPSTNAGRRSALMAKVAHVEFFTRDIAAFQHSQHLDQGFEFDVSEPQLLGGFEVLSKHCCPPIISHTKSTSPGCRRTSAAARHAGQLTPTTRAKGQR